MALPADAPRAQFTPPRPRLTLMEQALRSGEDIDPWYWRNKPVERPAARFKPGDRVRVCNYLPRGSEPYGDGDEGTFIGYDREYCVVQMDRLPGLLACWDRDGRCLELVPPKADAEGWIAHTPGDPMPCLPQERVIVQVSGLHPGLSPVGPASEKDWKGRFWQIVAWRRA